MLFQSAKTLPLSLTKKNLHQRRKLGNVALKIDKQKTSGNARPSGWLDAKSMEIDQKSRLRAFHEIQANCI